MPLYEYRCSACHRPFELLQTVGATASDAVCPECGAHDPQRQHSTFAVASSGPGAAATAGAGASFDGGGCGLPQCGGGRCAGGDWN